MEWTINQSAKSVMPTEGLVWISVITVLMGLAVGWYGINFNRKPMIIAAFMCIPVVAGFWFFSFPAVATLEYCFGIVIVSVFEEMRMKIER